ncbi:hypothetical protein JXL19_03935, partial [bacterium]|nr:hypothetical protein [bacterium]
FYSQRMPETFPMPAGQSKKYWIMDFKKDLQNAVKGLPSRTGSAVIEGIFISSRRLNEYDGDKFLIIYSDMRQFTPGIWNFEKEIPEPDRFKKWIDQQYLNPLLDPDTQVTVCGFKPYLANNDTVKISPVEYGKLQNLWLSIFKGWGRKVILTETFNPKNVYGGNKNE